MGRCGEQSGAGMLASARTYAKSTCPQRGSSSPPTFSQTSPVPKSTRKKAEIVSRGRDGAAKSGVSFYEYRRGLLVPVREEVREYECATRSPSSPVVLLSMINSCVTALYSDAPVLSSLHKSTRRRRRSLRSLSRRSPIRSRCPRRSTVDGRRPAERS